VKADELSLLKEIHCLEIVARRNVTSLLAGNYRSTIIGRGMDFHEARRYVQGESIRQIDWKMTARMGEPYVKTFLEERQREVFVAVDVSPSMFCGWHRRNKMETAIEIAATIAVSAVDAGDKLGFLTFSDRVHRLEMPRIGREQLFSFVHAMMKDLENGPPEAVVSDPRTAIHSLQHFRGRAFVVFLISDFLDADVPEDLDYLTARHDLSLMHVFDEIEFASDSPARFPAMAPEGGGLFSAPGKPEKLGDLEKIRQRLRSTGARHGCHFTSLSTTDDIGKGLAVFFNRRRGLQRR